MLRDWVLSRGAPITIRLVKGAYWDYEVLSARRLGWPEPVYLEKWQSDASFERCTRFLLRHHDRLRPAFGSHNVRSLAHAIAAAEAMGLPPSAYELQTLYGMGDAIQGALVDRGNRVRVYTPYGALLPGMAYLVRRLLENTSNESFLKLSSAARARDRRAVARPRGGRSHADPDATSQDGTDCGSRRTAAVPQRAADGLRAGRVPRGDATGTRGGPRPARPALPADHRRPGGSTPARGDWRSLDPGHSSRAVGETSMAGVEHADRAVAAARAAQAGVGRDAGPRPRRGPGPHGRDLPIPTVRAGRVGGLRVRQALGRGRRRHRRGDRLLRVLRPRDHPAVRAPASRRPRRDQLHRAPAARRGGDHPALELPAGDPDRHDRGGAGGGQRRDRQAGRAVARDGLAPAPRPARGRPATRRARLPARAGRGGRPGTRQPPGRGRHRLHRLARRGAADQPPGRARSARARTTSSG